MDVTSEYMKSIANNVVADKYMVQNQSMNQSFGLEQCDEECVHEHVLSESKKYALYVYELFKNNLTV